MLRFGTWMIVAVSIGSGGACCTARQTDPRPASQAATQPSAPPLAASQSPKADKPKTSDPEVFEYPAAKVKLKYPGGWKKRNEPENVLSVSPKPDDPPAPELSLAVPKLPFHLKGMIPLGAVKSGYFDDLKKRMTGVKEDECPPVKIAGASAVKRFVAEGKDKKLGDRKLDVLLITKGDTLYVITSEAPADDFETAHSAMECVVSSLEWMN